MKTPNVCIVKGIVNGIVIHAQTAITAVIIPISVRSRTESFPERVSVFSIKSASSFTYASAYAFAGVRAVKPVFRL